MQNFISMIMNSLKSMSLIAIIDILVVAFIFYKGYMLIKETRAEQLLKGIAFIIILIPISSILNLSDTLVRSLGWTCVNQSLFENKLLRQNDKENFSFSAKTCK